MREPEAFEILQMIVDEMGIPPQAANLKALTARDFKKIRALCLAAATLLSPEKSEEATSQRNAAKSLETENQSLNELLKSIEKNAIYDALSETNFNKTKAAELLGITPRQLRYKLAAHDMS